MLHSLISPRYTGLVTVTGDDAFPFLQSIVTHDLGLLDNQEIIQACLLTAQGKFLHDFYVRKINGGYSLACEPDDRTNDLAQRLSLYKLRAAVLITPLPSPARATKDLDFFVEWDQARIRSNLPDGSRDAEIGVSTLAELNLDTVATSYTKGCYIGQELVARMHNRNLGKRHLVGVEFFSAPPLFGSEIDIYGQMRSSCGSIGLVMMPRDIELTLKQGKNENAPFRLLGL